MTTFQLPRHPSLIPRTSSKAQFGRQRRILRCFRESGWRSRQSRRLDAPHEREEDGRPPLWLDADVGAPRDHFESADAIARKECCSTSGNNDDLWTFGSGKHGSHRTPRRRRQQLPSGQSPVRREASARESKTNTARDRQPDASPWTPTRCTSPGKKPTWNGFGHHGNR